MMTGHGSYRPDIDGLRAVAVLSVALYHLGIGPLTGGFVGVDVFFVISGFLITSIISRQIEQGSFSLLAFYDRRIRRIAPALLAMTACTLAAGYFLLLPGDYEALARQATYAVFGTSNFYFLNNTGYFEQEAEMMPLLQTWSLGVEEQFYLFWPLMLIGIGALARRMRLAAVVTLCVLAAVSFSLSVSEVATAGERATAFYMLHTRAWELALGAIVAFLPAPRRHSLAQLAAATGLLLVVGSAFLLSAELPFPGLNAVYPCLGAALIIAARDKDTFVAKALSLPPIVWLGLISYSLYLWHWPLLVYYRFYNSGAAPSQSEGLVLLAMAIAVGWASWRYVEQPFRGLGNRPAAAVAAGLSACAALALLSIGISSVGGMPERLPREYAALQNLEVMWKWDCKGREIDVGAPGCLFGADWITARHKVFLWGDSHADHLAPIIQAAYARTDTAIMLYDGCAPMLGGSVSLYIPKRPDFNARCQLRRRAAMNYLRAHPEVSLVILSGRWATKLEKLYTDDERRSTMHGQELLARGLTEVIEGAKAPGRSFVLVGPMPYWRQDPVQCTVGRGAGMLRGPCEAAIPADRYWREHAPIHAVLANLAQALPQVSLVRPGDALCRGTECIAAVGGELLYRDVTHLRRNLRPETYDALANLLGFTSLLRQGPPIETSGVR